MLTVAAGLTTEADAAGVKWVPDNADCWLNYVVLNQEYNLASAYMTDPKGTFGYMRVDNVEYWSQDGARFYLLDSNREPVASGEYDASAGTLRLEFSSENDASHGQDEIPSPVLLPLSVSNPTGSCTLHIEGSS